MVGEGRSAWEIAKYYGVSSTTARRYCSAAGVTPVKPSKLESHLDPHGRQAEAAALRAKGMTWAAIGDALGVTQGRACQLAGRHTARQGTRPHKGVTP